MIDSASRYGALRHLVISRSRRILNESDSSGVTHRLHTESSIASRPRKNHRDGSAPLIFCKRDQKSIDGRSTLFGILDWFEFEVSPFNRDRALRRGGIYELGLDFSPVDHLGHRKGRALGQNLREKVLRSRVEMKHNEKRQTTPLRYSGEKGL